jgi:aryl-alcohol dehydrogenase-like predicted oxidoreductase
MKANEISRREHWVAFQSVQLSYSLADRTIEREIVPMCQDQGMGIIAYFPLAGGILSGKYAHGQIPEGSRAAVEPRFQTRLRQAYLDLADVVTEVAQLIERTPAEVALAWLLTRPETSSAIVGASRPEQIISNAGAADITFDAAHLGRLNQASEAFRWTEPFGDARLAR